MDLERVRIELEKKRKKELATQGAYIDDEKIKVKIDQLKNLRRLVQKKNRIDKNIKDIITSGGDVANSVLEELDGTIKEILKHFTAIYDISTNLINFIEKDIIEKIPSKRILYYKDHTFYRYYGGQIRKIVPFLKSNVRRLKRLNKNIETLNGIYLKELQCKKIKEYFLLVRQEGIFKVELGWRVNDIHKVYTNLETISEGLKRGDQFLGHFKTAALLLALNELILIGLGIDMVAEQFRDSTKFKKADIEHEKALAAEGKGVYIDDNKIKVETELLEKLKSLIKEKSQLNKEITKSIYVRRKIPEETRSEFNRVVREMLRNYRVLLDASMHLIRFLEEVIAKAPPKNEIIKRVSQRSGRNIVKLKKLNKNIGLLHSIYRRQLYCDTTKEYLILLKEENAIKRKLKRKQKDVNTIYKELELISQGMKRGDKFYDFFVFMISFQNTINVISETESFSDYFTRKVENWALPQK